MTFIESLPLVSVVVPAYNHARYLPEAIDSILGQTYPNIELIVLDDGSTDETPQILQGYGDRLIWGSHENMGQARTLNKGWAMSKGKILAYLSADDVLFPDAVAKCIKALADNPATVACYPDFKLIDPQSRVVRSVCAPEFDYLEMVSKFVCAPGPGAFFRRDAFIRAGNWDPELRHSPDYEFWLRLGRYGDFVHVREQLAAFRLHEDSQSFAKTTVHRAEEAVRIIEGYFALPDLPDDVLARKDVARANANYVVAQLHLRSSRYVHALRRIAAGFRCRPSSLFAGRVVRILVNGLLYRPLHRLSWLLRRS